METRTLINKYKATGKKYFEKAINRNRSLKAFRGGFSLAVNWNQDLIIQSGSRDIELYTNPIEFALRI